MIIQIYGAFKKGDGVMGRIILGIVLCGFIILCLGMNGLWLVLSMITFGIIGGILDKPYRRNEIRRRLKTKDRWHDGWYEEQCEKAEIKPDIERTASDWIVDRFKNLKRLFEYK